MSAIDHPFGQDVTLTYLYAGASWTGNEVGTFRELFFEIEKDYLDERNKKKRYDSILKNPYFNALQVKYAYALTCHKSQGGQWDCVFIDAGYLNEDDINPEYFRWLYTALTRAKKQVYLINFKEEYFME
jgi:exodeoxyribonuclease-5